jgi:hypothetical protein
MYPPRRSYPFDVYATVRGNTCQFISVGVFISSTNGEEMLTRNGSGVMLSLYELWLTLIFIPPVS